MARSLIIDTDPGVDDVLAILLALASPEVDLKLLSICFGNTHAASAHANTLKIYHLLANEFKAVPDALKRYVGYVKGKTTLAVGADEPIGGEKAVAAYFVRPLSCLVASSDPCGWLCGGANVDFVWWSCMCGTAKS